MKKINANARYSKKAAFNLSAKGSWSEKAGKSLPTTTTVTSNPTTHQVLLALSKGWCRKKKQKTSTAGAIRRTSKNTGIVCC